MTTREGRDPSDGTPALGSVLEGRYKLLDEIGAGGIGWVFRAEHLTLGHHVAVKMLQTRFVGHEQMRPRFEREAKALALLSHPNIVSLIDYSVADDRPYLVMEMLEGRPLSALIDEGPIPEQRARPIIRQILEALAYAHGRGFLHRDLKPDNVFLVNKPPDFVKLLDFGFVKLLDPTLEDGPTQVLTRTGSTFGTTAYMSPEQISADRTGAPTDVYSLGIMIHEMLAGERPFKGENTDIVRQHLTTAMPTLRLRELAASPELDAWLHKATAKRASERFPSAVEMLAAFDTLPERLLHASGPAAFAPTLVSEIAPVASVSSHTKPARPRPKPASRGAGMIFLLATIVMAITAGIIFMRGGDPSTEETQAEAELRAIDLPSEANAHTGTRAARRNDAVLGPSPFVSRPRVRLIANAEARVIRGDTLSESTERALKEWARAHHGDPRPHLVLAMHYVNRRYVRDAIERFRLANHVSPEARNDLRMLEHLLTLAKSGDVTREAADTIVLIYGGTAKPAVRAARAEAGLAPAVLARLVALEARL